MPSPPRPRRRASTERLARYLAAVCLLSLSLFAAPLRATPPANVVVEIDGAAERIVDARSARRLVPLELSDVSVPPSPGLRSAAVLFFRVLARSDGGLRIELWERGEYHGARVLSAAGESPQLFARRVALAAAELVRRFARKREASIAREQKLLRAAEARARQERARTQDGPVALRSELAFAAVPGELVLLGTRLGGELTLRGPLRLDVGGETWAGWLTPSLHVALQAVSLGPAYRLALAPKLDLDFAAQAAALLVQMPTATSLDGIVDQNSSWTARSLVAMRLQLGLSRQVRVGVGVEAGALLRNVSYGFQGRNADFGGAWWSANLGVVLTPPR